MGEISVKWPGFKPYNGGPTRLAGDLIVAEGGDVVARIDGEHMPLICGLAVLAADVFWLANGKDIGLDYWRYRLSDQEGTAELQSILSGCITRLWPTTRQPEEEPSLALVMAKESRCIQRYIEARDMDWTFNGALEYYDEATKLDLVQQEIHDNRVAARGWIASDGDMTIEGQKAASDALDFFRGWGVERVLVERANGGLLNDPEFALRLVYGFAEDMEPCGDFPDAAALTSGRGADLWMLEYTVLDLGGVKVSLLDAVPDGERMWRIGLHPVGSVVGEDHIAPIGHRGRSCPGRANRSCPVCMWFEVRLPNIARAPGPLDFHRLLPGDMTHGIPLREHQLYVCK